MSQGKTTIQEGIIQENELLVRNRIFVYHVGFRGPDGSKIWEWASDQVLDLSRRKQCIKRHF